MTALVPSEIFLCISKRAPVNATYRLSLVSMLPHTNKLDICGYLLNALLLTSLE